MESRHLVPLQTLSCELPRFLPGAMAVCFRLSNSRFLIDGTPDRLDHRLGVVFKAMAFSLHQAMNSRMPGKMDYSPGNDLMRWAPRT